ncbi:MAG: AI-2E family transporter [Candidatus Obscuribacterales bacterium]|nr:AI-2E family transporter [Candidatus Obscuribacterales bacterium]
MFRWIATFIIIWFIYQVRHVFPPIIVGGIIAYLVLPVVQALSQKTRLPIGVATAVVYVTILGALASAIWLLGPAIAKEAKELADPQNQQALVHKAVEQITGIIKYQGDVDQLTEQVLNGIFNNLSKPEELQKGVGEISHLALSLLVCVVSSIYFTLDSQTVGRFFLRYVPENKRMSIIDLFGRMNRMLSKYVQGQILLIVIMSSFAWLFLHFGLSLLGFGNGMKYALPVAILSGFLEIIPVLGPILATTTATLVGIAQFGPHAALVIIIGYTLARWVEDYAVVPAIIGHAVELHPLAVIFAVLCGETLAGGLGMLIAIPVAACIKLVLDYFYTGELPVDKPAKRKKHGRLNRFEEAANAASGVESQSKPESASGKNDDLKEQKLDSSVKAGTEEISGNLNMKPIDESAENS